MKKKVLFVVHRFYPYPGGSEINTYRMAKECVTRGFDVSVYSAQHKGDVDGIRVSHEPKILLDKYDLVIVHGADCYNQDHVHKLGMSSPVLYLIVKPSRSETALLGMKKATYLGCGSLADLNHACNYGYLDKVVRVPYGIPHSERGVPGFREKYGIETGKMFMSAGGFWKHKGFEELYNAFREAAIPDTTLCLFGYHLQPAELKTTERIKVFAGLPSEVIHDAICEADLFIMNSTAEGFGLVILEAMLNKTHWAARPVGGISREKSVYTEYCNYGKIYETRSELIEIMRSFERDEKLLDDAFKFHIDHHLVSHTVDAIERCMR